MSKRSLARRAYDSFSHVGKAVVLKRFTQRISSLGYTVTARRSDRKYVLIGHRRRDGSTIILTYDLSSIDDKLVVDRPSAVILSPGGESEVLEGDRIVAALAYLSREGPCDTTTDAENAASPES